MRKVLILVFISFFLIVLTGCNKKEESDKGDNNIMNVNSIVLYFSATGSTKKVAEKISKITNSDIIEIIPENNYTEDDLNYNNDNSRANIEQNDSTSRPKIKNDIVLKDYDVIYLGYPIWWETYPRIILTLLDSVSLEGKTIVPFCTSGSSGIEKSIIDLKEYRPNINFIDGKRFEYDVSEQELESWIKTLNLNSNKIYIKIDDKVLPATLQDNSSSKALIEKLQQSDITLNMSDYGNFEKVGKLDFTLPRNDEQITTSPGDIILYLGNNITIYYDTNTYNFTKLGKIDNINKEELKNILGNDDVTITFSLNN